MTVQATMRGSRKASKEPEEKENIFSSLAKGFLDKEAWSKTMLVGWRVNDHCGMQEDTITATVVKASKSNEDKKEFEEKIDYYQIVPAAGEEWIGK